MTARVRRRKRRRRTKGRRWLRRSLRWLAALPFLFVAVTVLQVASLRFVDPPVTAFMAARQIEAWVEGEWGFRVDRSWHDLDAIAPSARLAVIAAEDQRFADHHGFDFDAIAQALDESARGGRMRGASTISQQVAKNLFLWQEQSWLRKGLEAWYTLLIELMWPKRRILEVYVNVAELGDGIYGVPAAAQRFWSKDASRLTPAESARLAAVLPAPRRYDARQPGLYVRRRAAWIQRQMRQLGGESYLRRLE